jgi:hypothetical protein
LESSALQAPVERLPCLHQALSSLIECCADVSGELTLPL